MFNLLESEKGNILLLHTEECYLNAWIQLETSDRWLEISFRSGNYPSLHVATITVSGTELSRHIRKDFDPDEWVVKSMCLDGVADTSGRIIPLQDLERRSQVKVIQISQNLSCQDRESLPAGSAGMLSIRYYDVPNSVIQAEKDILDWFHSTVPIKRLDDFEISVLIKPLRLTLVQGPHGAPNSSFALQDKDGNDIVFAETGIEYLDMAARIGFEIDGETPNQDLVSQAKAFDFLAQASGQEFTVIQES